MEATAVAVAVPGVLVKTNGMKKFVEFVEGLKVGEVLAGVGLTNMPSFVLFFVNGKAAHPSDRLKAGDEVIVAPRIKNG